MQRAQMVLAFFAFDCRIERMFSGRALTERIGPWAIRSQREQVFASSACSSNDAVSVIGKVRRLERKRLACTPRRGLPWATSETLALQSDIVRKHSGHSRQLLQIQNVRDENRPRVEGPRSAAMARAFRTRLHKLTQVPGDRLNSAGANLRTNRFVICHDLFTDQIGRAHV